MSLQTDDEIFRAMELPDYYGGPRLYQTDYSRPFIPQPPARQVTAEQRAEMGRRIEAWMADVRRRLPDMEEEMKAAAYAREECVRSADADEVIGDVISILEAFDG